MAGSISLPNACNKEGTSFMVNLIAIGCAKGPPEGTQVPGEATERCERDFLRLIFCLTNSNVTTSVNRLKEI